MNAEPSTPQEVVQTPIKNWWLLGLCGVLDAIISVIYLVMQHQDGPLTFHAWNGAVVFQGKLMLAAGVSTIAAGIWKPAKGKSWLLVLNGVACSALGLIFAFWTGRLAFTIVALLVVVMAMSIGAYALATARTLRRQHQLLGEWLLAASGVASFAFALAFSAFVFRWIKLDPASPGQSLRWLGAYFGFSAICMLGLALHLHGLGPSQPGEWEHSPVLADPKHAHLARPPIGAGES